MRLWEINVGEVKEKGDKSVCEGMKKKIQQEWELYKCDVSRKNAKKWHMKKNWKKKRGSKKKEKVKSKECAYREGSSSIVIMKENGPKRWNMPIFLGLCSTSSKILCEKPLSFSCWT